MNPYLIEALCEAIERFAREVAAGRTEKAEDYAIVAFGLAAMFPSIEDAAHAGLQSGECADA